MSNGINKLTETQMLRQFGKFSLDPQKKMLWRGEESVPLPLKAVEILCVLIERRGKLVTKDEILSAVWKDTVVEESNVTNNISLLRKLFKDCGEANFIETIPSRGYRFVGEVADIYEREEVVFERHFKSQALIEEFPDSGEKILQLPPAIQKGTKIKQIVTASVGIILLATGIFAFWNWNSTKKKAGISDIKSIAVLPFRTFEEAAIDENFRLRLMDSFITKLGKIDSLSVRPTSSTMKFVKSNEDPIAIGKKLEVDAILEGSIQIEANRLRITLQLVSVKNGEQIWSDQFDGATDKLLDLQNSVSSKLIAKLDLSSEQNVEFSKRPTNNSEAYEEYLKGRYFWNKRTSESLKSAISSFEKAINLDAKFADAYVGLADSYYLLFDYSYDTSPKNVEIAKENLNKAIELNPNLSEAYTTLGLIQTTYDWNWKAAEESLRKAKELSPNSSSAHHRFGTLLLILRRFDEAEAELRKAKSLDPISSAINMNLGVALMSAKRFDDAIIQLQKTLEIDPNFVPPRWYMARCIWLKGSKKESLLESAKAAEGDGDKALADKIRREIDLFDENTVVKNWAAEWEKNISPTGFNHHDLAILSALIKDKENTLAWLEKSVAAHHPWATWINAEPDFDFVRNEPRFKELLGKMNLLQN